MATTQTPPDNKIPDLLTFERFLLVAVIAGAFGVGALGLIASFDTVGQAAQQWGFRPSWILPVAIDTAIPVFSLAHLLLIRADMPMTGVRAIPWVLTGITVYLNVASAGGSLAAQLGHGALPLLWVACSEIAAHVYRALIGAVTGRRMERVRKSRWMLAPVSTALLWRRMILWEETSYRAALLRERDRVLARADLRETYGRRWRQKAPRRQRTLLRIGELAPVPTGTVNLFELEPTNQNLELLAAVPNQMEPAEPIMGQVPELAEPAEPAIEPTPEPDEPSVGTSSELAEPAEPAEPRTGRHARTANLGDRSVKKNGQVSAVLNLISELGFDAVTLPVVMERTGMAKTTAYNRLIAARVEWDETVAS